MTDPIITGEDVITTIRNGSQVYLYTDVKMGKVSNTGKYGLIMRLTPEKTSDNSNKIGLIKDGTTIRVLGYSKDNPNYLFVEFNGMQGFASCVGGKNEKYIIYN